MQSSPPSQQPSHSNEIEHRLTHLEVHTANHGDRITLLERVLYCLIIALSGIMHEKLPGLIEAIVK